MLLSMLALAAMQDAPLEPSDKWVVNYAESMCTAERPLADGTALFGFRPSGIAGQSAMLVLGLPPGEDRRVRRFKGSLMIEDGGEPIDLNVTAYSLRNGSMRLATMTVDKAAMDRLRVAKSLRVPVAEDRQIAVAPGNLGQALAALDACSDDLAVSLGADPALLAAAVERPRVAGDITRFFGRENYPVSAMSSGAEGRAVAFVEIDATGNPVSCTIATSTKNAELDAATCRGAMQSRYTPAKDAAGNPLRSWFTLSVVWQIG